DAVRDFVWQQQGKFDFYPKELCIENDALGKPIALPNVSQTFTGHCEISIAHKDNISVAIASEKPIGIDIEKIEPRNDNFIGAAMAEAELALIKSDTNLETLQEDLVTRIWSAKEAVAKKLGTGLQG